MSSYIANTQNTVVSGMSSTDPGYDQFGTPVKRFGSAILRRKPEAGALPTKAAINILGLHLNVSTGGSLTLPTTGI
ncbi:hypothetical protein BQ8794_260012 [Mesorhizobium prunaredense]|uniref:Uncharacterized protein n=1 Tax=Mesorhizobium prunaredense TaxID=1631249 RepID=A0A1R3V8G4_9HYPH|nr:hypothetical protein BQ8794_260012 [Mesorhizobium prunaredense]